MNEIRLDLWLSLYHIDLILVDKVASNVCKAYVMKLSQSCPVLSQWPVIQINKMWNKIIILLRFRRIMIFEFIRSSL